MILNPAGVMLYRLELLPRLACSQVTKPFFLRRWQSSLAEDRLDPTTLASSVVVIVGSYSIAKSAISCRKVDAPRFWILRNVVILWMSCFLIMMQSNLEVLFFMPSPPSRLAVWPVPRPLPSSDMALSRRPSWCSRIDCESPCARP